MNRSVFWSKQEAGISVLEQAAILPIILILIFGAVDINTALQSYAALREGVRMSLRCTYAVAGDCIETSPDERPRLYNVSEVISDSVVYGKEFDYNGDGYWLDLPIYNFSAGSATVLNNIHYNVEVFNTTAVKPLYNSTGEINFDLRKSTFPFITGASALSPSFRYFRNQSESYASILNQSLSVSGSTTSSTPQRIGAHTFRIDSPLVNSHCFRSTSEDQGNSVIHSPNFGARCETTRVGIVIHVSGSPTGTSAGADGAVLMRLVQDGTVTDLGGRAISDPNGSGNFVPRGVHARNRVKESFWTAYPEFGMYKDVIIDYNKNAKLVFHLKSNDGSTVAWNGGSVRIFAAKYAPVTNHPVNCSNQLLNSECETDSNCNVTALPPDLNVSAVNCNSVHSYQPFQAMGCIEDEAHAMQDLSAILIDQFGSDDTLSDYAIQQAASCGIQPRTISCAEIGQTGQGGSQPNYGVPQLADSNGHITSSPQANAICPPESGNTSNIYWTEHSQSIPNFPEFNWTREDCSITAPQGSELPGYLNYFPKLALGPGTITDHQALDAGDADPRVLKNEDPRYSCSEIPLSSNHFSEENYDLPSTSLFKGIHADLGCGWEDSLYTDALNNGLEPNAFFEAERNYAGEEVLPGIPTDTCITYRIGYDEPDTLIDHGIFEAGSFPSVCDNGNCQFEFVGFGEGSSGGTEFDFELAAEYYGFNEIKASYPRARWNCAGEDCVTLNIEEDNGFLVGTGQVQVPMKLLFNKTITLAVTERERYEGEYIE